MAVDVHLVCEPKDTRGGGERRGTNEQTNAAESYEGTADALKKSEQDARTS